MKAVLIFLFVTSVIWRESGANFTRRKGDAVGALDIVTNHATPIHADVNRDGPRGANVQPCTKKFVPSAIESGVGFQVLPPKDVFYEVKSLRKSYPLTSDLYLVRCVNRIVALAIIIFSAAVEFYPVVVNVYNSLYDLFYVNKY